MSTRSSIGILKDGKVRQVYCHCDGYIEHNGYILFSHYNSSDKVEKILELGDLSFLTKQLEPTGEHSFDDPEGGVTVAYHRDRGEKLNEPKEMTIDEYKEYLKDSWCEFAYLYDTRNDTWLYAKSDWDYLDDKNNWSAFKRLDYEIEDMMNKGLFKGWL